MSPFRKPGAKTYQVRVYDSRGTGHVRSTETRIKEEADAIDDALQTLRDLPPKYHEILDAVITRRFTLRQVVDAYDHRRRAGGRVVYDGFDALLELLHDIDIKPLVTQWFESLANKVSDDTRKHYQHSVLLFIANTQSTHRSHMTLTRIQDWIDEMDAEPATARKRGSGLSRFCDWLVRPRGILERNPMRDVELPPPGAPRCHYLETPEAIALADAQSGPYRLLSALLAGTGLEVSVAIETLTRRHVTRDTREIHAPGTKTYNRDRIVRVTDWAWPYVEELIDGLLPSARLFRSIDRYRARDKHFDAIEALAPQNSIYTGYTMRDARHTWAVRAVRAGMPIEMVARQLGHANGVLALKVYGRFVPRSEERTQWERIATLQDEQRRKSNES